MPTLAKTDNILDYYIYVYDDSNVFIANKADIATIYTNIFRLIKKLFKIKVNYFLYDKYKFKQ